MFSCNWLSDRFLAGGLGLHGPRGSCRGKNRCRQKSGHHCVHLNLPVPKTTRTARFVVCIIRSTSGFQLHYSVEDWTPEPRLTKSTVFSGVGQTVPPCRKVSGISDAKRTQNSLAYLPRHQ